MQFIPLLRAVPGKNQNTQRKFGVHGPQLAGESEGMQGRGEDAREGKGAKGTKSVFFPCQILTRVSVDINGGAPSVKRVVHLGWFA